MNIFLLSYERNAHKHFAEQAAFHCDKHVIKMIAESTQMLVTALQAPNLQSYAMGFVAAHPDKLPCKPLGLAHAKHPCVRWSCASINHVHYLVRLALALCNEKTRRYPLNPEHQYQAWLMTLARDFARIGYEPHDAIPPAFPVAVKKFAESQIACAHHEVVTIHRSYYAADKASFATWKAPAATPVWFLLETTCINDLTTN
jgi:hypothetical protein